MHYAARLKAGKDSEGMRTEEQVVFGYPRRDTSEKAGHGHLSFEYRFSSNLVRWRGDRGLATALAFQLRRYIHKILGGSLSSALQPQIGLTEPPSLAPPPSTPKSVNVSLVLVIIPQAIQH